MSKLATKLIEKEKKERTGYLDLGRCGLTEWPEELFDCTWLETLIVSNAYWDIVKGKRVDSANKGGLNNLPVPPSKFRNLRCLQTLILGSSFVHWRIDNIDHLVGKQ